jgi:hypothetical protein
MTGISGFFVNGFTGLGIYSFLTSIKNPPKPAKLQLCPSLSSFPETSNETSSELPKDAGLTPDAYLLAILREHLSGMTKIMD